MKQHLPPWMHEWIGMLQIALAILAILLVAWLLRLLSRRLSWAADKKAPGTDAVPGARCGEKMCPRAGD